MISSTVFKLKLYWLLILVLIALLVVYQVAAQDTGPVKVHKQAPACQTGDLIFQVNVGGQGRAVQLATGSKYTHVGIVIYRDGKPFVFEAVQPVRFTPLDDFIRRGDGHHYVMKRLSGHDTLLTPERTRKLEALTKDYNGKDYDLYFGWSDDLIYCSELVWKMYQRSTGLEIGKLQKLKEFNLEHPIVRAKLAERYGDKIPYNEYCISPGAIFESDLLYTVQEK